MRSVTLEEIAEQRRLSWRGFHPEAFCHRCGRPNVWSWAAPSPLWNAVMRKPDGSEQWEGIVCPPCFAEMAESSGVVPAGHHTWAFAPDLDVAGLWTDADGREWDYAQWLWRVPAVPEGTGNVGPMVTGEGGREAAGTSSGERGRSRNAADGVSDPGLAGAGASAKSPGTSPVLVRESAPTAEGSAAAPSSKKVSPLSRYRMDVPA